MSLSIRPLRKDEKPEGLGVIRFGKSRPSRKMVDIDIEMDARARRELVEAGLEMIRSDEQALINYAIVKALENMVNEHDLHLPR